MVAKGGWKAAGRMRLVGRGILAGLVGMLLAGGATADQVTQQGTEQAAEQGVAQEIEKGVEQEIRLQYVESGIPSKHPPLVVAEVLPPEKGSAVEGRDAIAGRLSRGGKGGEWMPFLVDVEAGRFALDLDGDGEFSEIPANISEEIRATKRSGWQGHVRTVHVKGVSIDIPRGGACIRYRFDLAITDRRDLRPLNPGVTGKPNRFAASVCLQSGWEGAIEYEGRRVPLLVQDNLDGVLGAGDSLSFEERQSGPGGYSLSNRKDPSRSIIVGGEFYDLTYRFGGRGEGCEAVIGLAKSARPTGEILLEGEDIAWFVLKGPEEICVLGPGEAGEATVKVPVGDYSIEDILLRREEEGQVYWAKAHPPKTERIVVEEGASVPVRMGGPLSGNVGTYTRDNRLCLVESITGVDGFRYHIWKEKPRTSPPEAFGIVLDETYHKPFPLTIRKWGVPVSSLLPPIREYGLGRSYGWRVPWFVSGTVTVTSEHEVGPFGSSAPVEARVEIGPQRPWVRMAALWAVVLLLVLFKRNWKLSAWWIWAPVLGAWVVQYPMNRLSLPWGFNPPWRWLYERPYFTVYALALSTLLLLRPVPVQGAPWYKKLYALGRAVVLVMGFTMGAMLCDQAGPLTDPIVRDGAEFAVDVAPLLAGLILAGLLSRRSFTPARFCGWFLVYGLLAVPVLSVWMQTKPNARHLTEPVLFYGGLHVVTLLFILAAFANKFYRERLETTFGVRPARPV